MGGLIIVAKKQKESTTTTKSKPFDLISELNKLEPHIADAFTLYLKGKEVKTLKQFNELYKQFMGE